MTQPAPEDTPPQKTLLLIDLSAIWYPNWHTTADMQIGEAYHRTIHRVTELAEGYDHVAVCCDEPPYKRKEIFPAYKAQRNKPSANMVDQFQRVKDRLRADGFLLWSVQGYEADDIIATATRWAVQENLRVDIATGDKDLLQLVMENSVEVLKLSTNDRFDYERTVREWGVIPQLLGDVLSLMGDKSDNIPGVPKCGPKTAAKLIQDFLNLDNVIAAAKMGDEKIKPAMRKAIVDNAANIPIARQLIELVRDVPINCPELYGERQPQPLTETPADADFDAIPDADFDDTPLPSPEQPPPTATDTDKPNGDPTPADDEPLDATSTDDVAPVTALARADQPYRLALEPQNSGSAWKLAHILFNSRQYEQFKSPAAILAVMLRGRALGLDATTSLANFHIIKGRPSMHADLIRGLVLQSGKCEYFDLVESTRTIATWVTKRVGAKREVTMTWTIEDACAAQLVKREGDEYHGINKKGEPSNWDTYRRTMLRHRCGTELARAIYPDVTSGLYTPDELTDDVVI